MIRFQLLAATLSVWAFSACTGTSCTLSPLSVPLSRVATASVDRGSQAVDALAINIEQAPRGTRLYVTNFDNMIASLPPATPPPVADSVSVFELAQNVAAPLPSVMVGAQHSASYIAFDRAGKLYLSNWAAQTITVFDTRHGNAQLPSITGLTNAGGIAIDRHGKLYVSNGNQVDVLDTLHGNAALPSIPLQYSNVLALDPCGKLYVESALGQIFIFDVEHGNAPLGSIDLTSHSGPVVSIPFISGLLVDTRGKLYVATSENRILVFDTRHSNKQLSAIIGDSTFGPAGMVEDTRGRLYVANYRWGFGNDILVFDTSNANKLLSTITGDGMMGVNSLALQ